MPAQRGLAVSLTFADITADIRLAGVVPNAAVTLAALQVHGPESATLTYRTAEGNVAQRLISASQHPRLLASQWLRRNGVDRHEDQRPLGGSTALLDEPRRPIEGEEPVWLAGRPGLAECAAPGRPPWSTGTTMAA